MTLKRIARSDLRGTARKDPYSKLQESNVFSLPEGTEAGCLRDKFYAKWLDGSFWMYCTDTFTYSF